MARAILIPLDGSPESETVLPEVLRVLHPKGKVHLLRLVATESIGEGTAYLEKVRKTFFPGSAGIDIVRTGQPADGILRTALEKNIDLIAMTTHARRGLRRRFWGSVASEVVRKAQLPVLLTRPDTPRPARPIQRVLVPLDGLQPPSDLLESLRFLCPDVRAEIILLRVLPPLHDAAPQWAPEFSLSSAATPERVMQELADSLEEEGFYAWPVTCVGKAEDEILIHGKNLGVDLIAMTTHGRTGMDRFLEGSVSEKVLRRSPVAVLLQKPLVLHKPTLAGETHA
jgi:nucleotide-binding universal stress UspA family protein